jgi:hypothetical protein
VIPALAALLALSLCGLLTWQSARRVRDAATLVASLDAGAPRTAADQLRAAATELADRADR